MLMRTEAFNDLDRLTDQLFRNKGPAVMPIDAYRHEDDFFVHFDLPGVDPESIDLTIEKNVLRVTAQRAWNRVEGTQVLAAERPHGTFARQLFLGDSLDTDRIEAGYENGVLTVRLPVADKAKPRKVSVATGGTGPTSIETTSAAAV